MGRKSRTKRERKAREAQFKRGYLDQPPVKYPVRPRPSAGSTGSERPLAQLARETFLSLWSYPNVVRDEPQPNKGVIGKEIADLFVVFEDDIVLFSDKDCVLVLATSEAIDAIRRVAPPAEIQLWSSDIRMAKSPTTGSGISRNRCSPAEHVPAPVLLSRR
jgi:hypothetical protein